MGTPKISHEDFVVAYANARTLDDVVAATGMNKPAVQGRASMLRKRGVKLPRLSLPTQLDEFRVAQLNSLVKKHDIRKAKQF